MTAPEMSKQDGDGAANPITGAILDAALEVHSALGPGLLEKVYRVCLAEELRTRGHEVQEEVAAPVVYKGRRVEAGYRIDLLVDGRVIVEIKAVEETHPVHAAQLFTYLKLTNLQVSLLLNFNKRLMKNGITRVVRSAG